ncbi:MAG: urease accessory protein UreH [Acidobacteria bacterium]|nr:urease accessory protein UreH [Acidobacteriota bacterium]
MSEFFAFSTATTGIVLFYGFVLGLKHATEADHLAAVTTIVTERANVWTSALVGGLWGLGHTISLLAAGILVLVLNYQISERTERFLEFGVGVMLVFLGLNVIRKLVSGGHLHFHPHEHAGHTHAHPHLHERGDAAAAETHHGPRLSPRALIIGMVHGLAGSAALMLLIIPTIASRSVGLLYILIFGVGSIGGMMIMSFLVGLPFRFTSLKFHRFNHILQAVAGLISISLGLWIVYEKGFGGGLTG